MNTYINKTNYFTRDWKPLKKSIQLILLQYLFPKEAMALGLHNTNQMILRKIEMNVL